MIPKPKMIYRVEIFEGERLVGEKYVKPKHIHFWINADYREDGQRAVFNRCWVSPARFAAMT